MRLLILFLLVFSFIYGNGSIDDINCLSDSIEIMKKDLCFSEKQTKITVSKLSKDQYINNRCIPAGKENVKNCISTTYNEAEYNWLRNIEGSFYLIEITPMSYSLLTASYGRDLFYAIDLKDCSFIKNKHYLAEKKICEEIKTRNNKDIVNMLYWNIEVGESQKFMENMKKIKKDEIDKTINHETLLGHAVNNDSVESVKMLVEKGADIEKESKGLGPVVIAAINGYTNVFIYLMEHGADIRKNIRYKNEDINAVKMAIQNCRKDIIRYLISKGKVENKEKEEYLERCKYEL